MTREEKIILSEIEYRELQRPHERTDFTDGLYYGAIGALGNVLKAFEGGITAEQYQEEISCRDGRKK